MRQIYLLPTPPSLCFSLPRSNWIALAASTFLAATITAWFWNRHDNHHDTVVIISIDTLRADHLSSYGYTAGRTPNIDALAQTATVFDRAYAHVPQTLPSHVSIMTGLLPFDHGVRDDIGFTLKPNVETLASLFRQAGYRTAGFVSAYALRQDTGIDRGFDIYNAEFAAGSDERAIEQIRRSGNDTLAAAETWLSSQSDDKFFLFLHLDEPHMPYTPPAKYADLSPYDGEIADADEIVGRLISDLKKRRWYDAATIVLLSDHGEGLGDHGESEHGLFLYDTTMHVPLIIKTPSGTRGRHVTDPVQHIDLLPTLASVADLKVPSGLRGRDLLPLLRGTGHIMAQGIYAEALYGRYHFGWSELSSLTDDRYRFVDAPRSELYDLQRDPKEATNLFAERAKVGRAMRSGLDAIVAGRGVDGPSALSSEDREQLAGLGYVGVTNQTPTETVSDLAEAKDKAPLLMAYQSAIEAARQGRLNVAAVAFKNIVLKEPNMLDAWRHYGSVLVRLSRDEDAIEAFRAIVKQRPADTAAILDVAKILTQLGRYEEARSHAEIAVTTAPAAGHTVLAEISLGTHDNSGALREAALAEVADPTLPLIDYVHGQIEYNDHRYVEALPYLTRAYDRIVGRTMQIAGLRCHLADSLAHLHRYDEAERLFKEELAIYPDDLRARKGLAETSKASGRGGDTAQRCR